MLQEKAKKQDVWMRQQPLKEDYSAIYSARGSIVPTWLVKQPFCQDGPSLLSCHHRASSRFKAPFIQDPAGVNMLVSDLGCTVLTVMDLTCASFCFIEQTTLLYSLLKEHHHEIMPEKNPRFRIQ